MCTLYVVSFPVLESKKRVPRVHSQWRKSLYGEKTSGAQNYANELTRQKKNSGEPATTRGFQWSFTPPRCLCWHDVKLFPIQFARMPIVHPRSSSRVMKSAAVSTKNKKKAVILGLFVAVVISWIERSIIFIAFFHRTNPFSNAIHWLVVWHFFEKPLWAPLFSSEKILIRYYRDLSFCWVRRKKKVMPRNFVWESVRWCRKRCLFQSSLNVVTQHHATVFNGFPRTLS